MSTYRPNHRNNDNAYYGPPSAVAAAYPDVVSRERGESAGRRREDSYRRDDRRYAPPPPRRDRSRERRRRSRSPPPLRRRSRSPPLPRSRPRSPSPTSDVPPLSAWPRKSHNWDVPPVGYEHMTVQQVKETGIFPLPGQGIRPGMKITGLGIAPLVGNANMLKYARRLHVSNLPVGVTEPGLAAFFNSNMTKFGVAPGNCVMNVQIDREKSFAFLDLRTPEEATMAISLDGEPMDGIPLKLRRPKEYRPAEQMAGGAQLPGMDFMMNNDSDDKIFIGNLPIYLSEEQVRELLLAFGALHSFQLIKDPLTGASKGTAYCQFADSEVTDVACTGLHGMELGEKRLIVQRAKSSTFQGAMDAGVVPGAAVMTVLASQELEEDSSTVVQLMNMVVAEELEQDDEYEDIVEDIREECGKYGTVLSLLIPRPRSYEETPGLGKVFIEYDSVEGAKTAIKSLAGRKFGGRTIMAAFFPLQRYRDKAF